MKNELEMLLQREMTRKDFLKIVGVGLVAMTGLASLFKTLNTLHSNTSQSNSIGYGGSPYGGRKDVRNT